MGTSTLSFILLSNFVHLANGNEVANVDTVGVTLLLSSHDHKSEVAYLIWMSDYVIRFSEQFRYIMYLMQLWSIRGREVSQLWKYNLKFSDGDMDSARWTTELGLEIRAGTFGSFTDSVLPTCGIKSYTIPISTRTKILYPRLFGILGWFCVWVNSPWKVQSAPLFSHGDFFEFVSRGRSYLW